jgi:hypothetical protein
MTVLIIAAVAIGFVASSLHDLATPKDASKMEPESVFRNLVCDPRPESVRDIRATGDFSVGGDSVQMECQISPADFETVIKRAGFFRISLDSPDNPFGPLPARVANAEVYRSSRAGAEGRREVYLMTPPSHDRIYVSHFSH